MIRSIAINDKFEIIIDHPLEELRRKDIRWCWVDFNQPTKEETMKLGDPLHFHPLAIEDCIHKLQRPKLDYYEDYSFLVTHSLDSIELNKEEVNFFLGQNYIVSFHHCESNEIDIVWERVTRTKDIEKWDQYLVLYHAIDKLVDNYFPIVYKLEEDLDSIENNPTQQPMEKLLEQLFNTRHRLLGLRHTITPMRDLLYRILSSTRLEGIRQKQEYFSDIHDHLLKLTELIDANRELTNDIRDSYLSINSHQTNRIVKVLTVITTIFMPLTFIAGVYGMNFENMPELTWNFGYFLILLFMFVIGFGMFVWFKRKGWFD